MKRNLLLALAFLAAATAALAQGSLDPANAPAPTMKSLDQLEPRIPLGTVGGGTIATSITINESGSYVLVGNLTFSGTSASAITINASNVTLDLGGFTLSTGVNAYAGIRILGDRSGIVVRDGFIRGQVTYSEGVGYAGAGFEYGIYCYGDSTNNRQLVIENVQVSGVRGSGIMLPKVNSTIRQCSARLCGGYGLFGEVVADSSAELCRLDAIQGMDVSRSSGSSTGADGIKAQTVSHCRGTGIAGAGIRADLVVDSIGTSSTYDGIYARLVRGSMGSSVDRSGIFARDLAEDCTGSSSTASGISGTTVMNCTGTSTSGTGLVALCANNCRGERTGGTAISATIAIGCTANGTIVATNRYNMP